MESSPDIIQLIKKYTGEIKMNDHSDLCNDLGIDGDDFFDLIEEYSKSFEVNVDNYLWYFHSGEEVSSNIGGLLFKPPHKRVKHIPITPLLLTQFSKKGKWEIDYPTHELPKYRYDILINQVVFVVLVLMLVLWYLVKD